MQQRGLMADIRLHATGLVFLAVLTSFSQPDSPVADAAMRGDAATVRQLLAEGADVNAAQNDGMTALHWASERGDEGIVNTLLYAGANTAAVTRLGDYTPLHLAARVGHASIVATLLDAGASPSAGSSTGKVTPLHFVAASGSAAAVHALVEHGADVNARESEWGQTPLIFAVARNRLEAIDALIEAGADVSAETRVLDMEVRQQEDRIAGQLRDKVLASFREARGADADARGPDPSQVQAAVRAARQHRPTLTAPQDDSVDYEEAQPTPLSYAQLVGGQGGLTALHHAIREGYAEATRRLLSAGADINQVSAGDHTSPILMATINGHFDLALELLELGADGNLASDAGTTPLFAAVNTQWAPKARYPQQQAYQQQEASYRDVMRALLEGGSDPNARLTKHLWYMSYTFDLLGIDVSGATPFWRAAYATDIDAMRLLVEHGADPNIPTQVAPQRRFGRGDPEEDPSGLPPSEVGGPAVYPIHAASGVGYGEDFAGNAHRHVPDGWLPAVRYLVEEVGADVNARDHNGYSAVHHAAARGDNEMILYLVEQGADVKTVSRRGQTTVDMANGPVQRIQPFPETIALLESLGAKNNNNCLSCE